GAGDAPTAPLFGDDNGSGLAISPDSGVFRRVASGGHADLLTVERAYDPRRRRLRSEIVVDNTREISAVLRFTAAQGGRRVVVAAAGGVELYRAVLALLSRDQGIDPAALHAFADRLARPDAEEAYRAIEDLVGQLLARLAIGAARGVDEVRDQESAQLRRLGGR